MESYINLLESMTLQEAIWDTVHNSKKPAKVIASEIDMGLSHLTRAALPKENGSGCNFPADKITPTIRSTQKYLILDVIEQSVGRVGIKIPPIRNVSTADICRLTMASVREFGEMVAEVERALVNNEIDPVERKKIFCEGYQAIQAILSLMLACKGSDAQRR